MAVSDEPRVWTTQSLPARALSAAVMIPLAVYSVWTGGWLLVGLLTVVVVLALYELHAMAARAGYPVLVAPGILAGASVILLAATHQAQHAGVVLLSAGLWLIGASLRPPITGRLTGLAISVFGVIYVAGLSLHILWLRDLGMELVFLTLLGTWAADSCAFFVGVRWGKRPLAPHISPGKSVEGFVGGLIGTIVTVLAVGWFLTPEVSKAVLVLAGLMLGVGAPLGDLFESVLKRNLQAKDSGDVIPGHGGILDRIDSLLLNLPLAYYLFKFLGPVS